MLLLDLLSPLLIPYQRLITRVPFFEPPHLLLKLLEFLGQLCVLARHLLQRTGLLKLHVSVAFDVVLQLLDRLLGVSQL